MCSLPEKRWSFYPPARKEQIQALTQGTEISPLLAQILVNRNKINLKQAEIFLNPNRESLPKPVDVFKDLCQSIDILEQIIIDKEKIAICGDYDADGMTSTSLLLRAFRYLGANIDYAIPSRHKDGYGINNRIVEQFAAEEVKLIITVDNGISAHQAINRAKELGLKVIITDHHDLPDTLPMAEAILNPKMLEQDCPFWGLAGVGMAYVLAITTAERFGKLNKDLINSLLELFTLGTIADLAPLVGINRRLVKKGLRLLPKSNNEGIKALIQVSGLSDKVNGLESEDIGFKLGPRINAVGRIGDPQVVIELLTTEDPGIALERAMQCEAYNNQRQNLTQETENEAIKLLEAMAWRQDRVICLVADNWHHGVIGLVASRLVERYGAPTFIATPDEQGDKLRGSARGIPEFNIFEALEFAHNELDKYGGHPAAGGFSLQKENLPLFRDKLRQFAHQSVQIEDLQPLVKIDALVNFAELTPELYKDFSNLLHPWGIENEFPILWTPKVRILEQSIMGKNREHLQLKLRQDGCSTIFKAKAWRWGSYCPLPSPLDIAFKLEQNTWQGKTELQLNLVAVKI
jgi:single-stranded-DNA-specific exonuclease